MENKVLKQRISAGNVRDERNLRAFLLSQNVTYYQLGQKLGWTDSNIYGRVKLLERTPLFRLREYAQALNIDVSQLIKIFDGKAA